MLGSKQNLLWVWKHLNTSCVYLRLGYFDSAQYVSWRYFLLFTHHLGCLNSGCCLTNSLICHGHGKDPSCLPRHPFPSPSLPFVHRHVCNRVAQSTVRTKSTKYTPKRRGKEGKDWEGGKPGTAGGHGGLSGCKVITKLCLKWLCLSIIWLSCTECLLHLWRRL